MRIDFYFLYICSVKSQAHMIKLFDRRICHLSYSKRLLPLNFGKFKVPVRHSPWISMHSYWSMSWRAKYERSSAIITYILSSTWSFVFTRGLAYRNVFGANLLRYRYWLTSKYERRFSYEDYLDFVTPTFQHYIPRPTHESFVFLSF